MPKADNGGTPGADASADKKAGTITDDATGKKAGDNSNDDKGDATGGDKPKVGKLEDFTDEINEIVQKRLNRAKKDADEKAQLSKEQLLERERDDARNELRISNARDSFITKSGLDYGKASRLFKVYSADLEFDDNGKVSNLTEVLKQAKTEWPEFYKNIPEGGADLGGGNGDSGKKAGGGMNDIFRNFKRR